MENLSEGEARLFAKYWGRNDLIDDDQFWEDAFQYYADKDVLLPLQYNPLTVRMLSDMLDCPPGQCGECCRYKQIPVKPNDIQRIIEGTSYTEDDLNRLIRTGDDGGTYLSGQPQCPFLTDNVCSIYKWRPDSCYLFPLQTGTEAIVGGKPIKQMRIRIKCQPSMDVARKVITKAVGQGNKLLLPNLVIIPKEGTVWQ